MPEWVDYKLEELEEAWKRFDLMCKYWWIGKEGLKDGEN